MLLLLSSYVGIGVASYVILLVEDEVEHEVDEEDHKHDGEESDYLPM